MKALVLEQYNKLRIEEVPEPEISADEVLVRVVSCGVCGSDVHGFDGSSGRRIPPIIMGHEAAGVVARVGGGVRGLGEGERVTFDSMIWCGSCPFCRRGRTNLCENRRVFGVSCEEYRRDGAFAEYVAVPERIVYPIPDALSFDEAAMVEPVSVAVHAVNRSPLELGDCAVVVGVGMIGLLAVQALRAAGCGRIIAVDLADDRLETARRTGADETLNPSTTPVVEAVREMTGGLGADLTFEAVGAQAAVETAIECARKGGSVTLIGNIAPRVSFGLQSVVTREISLFGSCASANDYPACLELMGRGAIRVADLISRSEPLERGPEMFERLYNKEPKLTKVILKP